jgi:hypothetical protein
MQPQPIDMQAPLVFPAFYPTVTDDLPSWLTVYQQESLTAIGKSKSRCGTSSLFVASL